MTFLYLSSNQMGSGDKELGQKLLIKFLEQLADSDVKIDVVGCVNSAVFLSTTGSVVIESLKKLQQRGTKIASCGTCLDHYNLKKDLLIGEIGTMDQTVQIMNQADKVIRP